jgi:hypothetical protein
MRKMVRQKGRELKQAQGKECRQLKSEEKKTRVRLIRIKQACKRKLL